MEELIGGVLGILLESFGDLLITELLLPGACRLLVFIGQNVKASARFICGKAWEGWRSRRQASGVEYQLSGKDLNPDA